MALGDNRFAGVETAIQTVFTQQAVTVQVVASTAGQAVPRDRFGQPTNAPSVPIDTSVVFDAVTEDIKPTAEGGQPIQQMKFFSLPGTVNENDAVTWNGHEFRVSSVWPSTFGGILQVEYCKADRMVGS